MANKTADFDQYLGEIDEYIGRNGFGKEENPERIAQICSDAYRYAKGGVELQPQAQPLNPDELLNDEEFIAKILSNSTIVQKVVNQHMASVQSNQPPQVISSGGGTSPAAPIERPKNREDAALLAGAIFDSNFV